VRIGIPKETVVGETRVAATPETVKKYVSGKHTVLVERGAGLAARFSDEAYVQAGAELVDAAQALGAELVLKVRAPQGDELTQLARGAVLVGMLDPFNAEGLTALAQTGVTAFALEAAPRITRAQSLDVLSSQANLAGYKAVLLAANHYGRLLPMMMTAAGTLKAARVVVLGTGVAGLQAIATARRLGAVVEASDVRPAAKEQVESRGARNRPRRGRLRPAYAGGVDGAPGRAGVRTLPTGRYRDFYGAHPWAACANVDQRRDRTRHEAGFGHRRYGGRARRQLPAVGKRPDRGKAWGRAHWAVESARAASH